jgi:hypothetical protein
MPKKKARPANAKRSSTQLKTLKPAPMTSAEAKLVKGGGLPPEKKRQIAHDT